MDIQMAPKQYFNSYDENQSSSGLDYVYCPKCGVKLGKEIIAGAFRNCCPKCQFVQYVNPLPGVSILIEKEDKLLIGKRSQDSVESGKWCLPCGFVEHDENYFDAAHREVFEETGLEIEITSLIGVASIEISPNLHTIVIALTAKVISGTLMPGDDLVELYWLSKNEPFPTFAFEGDEYTIRKYFESELPRIQIDSRFKQYSQIRK